MIEHKMVTRYLLERYPQHCAECPAFRQYPYQCHNERGMEGDCMLGYMAHSDMRDFSGNTRFEGCCIESDPNVALKTEHKRPDRRDCPMRHENGNCTAAGGFCTSVNDPVCEALHNAFRCGEDSKTEWAILMLSEQSRKFAEKQLQVLKQIHEKVTADTKEVE